MRLFERLELTCAVDGDEKRMALVDEVESIKRHLVELLNSRPGNSECSPELGLLDLNDASASTVDMVVEIKRSIKSCIERFEPRISQVVVQSLSDPQVLSGLCFQVHATVNLAVGSTNATIDLLFNNKRYQCLS